MPHLNFKLSVIVAVLTALLLAGCGKKGPLYHPDSPRKPDQKQSQN
jgi:predicted small lipoprotein YifL